MDMSIEYVHVQIHVGALLKEPKPSTRVRLSQQHFVNGYTSGNKCFPVLSLKAFGPFIPRFI